MVFWLCYKYWSSWGIKNDNAVDFFAAMSTFELAAEIILIFVFLVWLLINFLEWKNG